jgi:prepilin-type N-terminal cleavage/methylation domain-containing protein
VVSREAMESRGFTLVELAIVLTMVGVLLAVVLGGAGKFTQDRQLRASAVAVTRQLQLARSTAMATGSPQVVQLVTASSPNALTFGGGGQHRRFALPRNVRFGPGGATTYAFDTYGRTSSSYDIVMSNAKGWSDTVSVQVSGLVVAR